MSKSIRKALIAVAVLILIIVVLIIAGIIPTYIRAYAMPLGIISFGNPASTITIPAETEGFGVKDVSVRLEDNNGRNAQILDCYLNPGRSIAFEYEIVTYSSLGTPIGFYSGIRLLKVEGCFTGPHGIINARNLNSVAVPIAINGGVPANAARVQTLTVCLDIQKSGPVTIYALQQGLEADGAAVAACP